MNKPLGLSPKHIEFKRAHLYDINPVGFGSMMIASTAGVLAYVGVFGALTQAIAPFISLSVAFLLVPVIALLTRGRYYLAREPHISEADAEQHQCIVCENEFEAQDMSHCPAYGGAICSLCCTLDARCHDQCKVGARFSDQIARFISFILPESVGQKLNRRWLQFFGFLLVIASIIAMLFWLVYLQIPQNVDGQQLLVSGTLIQVYLLLMIIIGVLIWLFVLANESRELALEESQRQTVLLSQEIKAHEKTDQALQKAKEAAEAANQAKSRYLTGISHELRSPLNSVLGYAQLLEKDSVLTMGQKTKVGLIKRNGEHLSDLIEGLLDISRIEAGRLELQRDEVYLKSMLNDLVEMFQLQADAKGIQFNASIASSIPDCVYADEKQLRQILINLLSNAIKYTEQGSVRFTVSYRSQVAEFLIEDTGSGIALEDHDRIFRPFERIRKPGAPQVPGTGLGLTITKLLTEIMGGELQLKSELGVGSAFRLMLMLSKVYEPSIKPENEKRIISYFGPKQTVMVVDDDPNHRGLISEILSPLGFVVIEATDAENGLSMLKEVAVDLFLLDISMPGINGWELTQKLRAEGVSQPIMMVSADSTEQLNVAETSVSRSLHDDYLVKPIRDSVLVEKVGKLLGLHWCYESKNAAHLPCIDITAIDGFEPLSTVSDTDLRLLISMTELGYVQGIENVLLRLKTHKASPAFISLIEGHLERYQFHEIITLCKKTLDE